MAKYRGPSEGEVVELVSVEQYDWERAKMRSSLSWLLSKVYSSKVPRELQDPFYENSEGHLSLTPLVVNLLSSSELYCQACSNMFPDTHTQWQGHWSIIQVLSRKGIYISDVQDLAVTETVLVQTAPFRLKAHLAMIDALMRAYTHEVASVENVVKAVRSFTTFPASSQLPDSSEEAVVFWINKVCTVLRTEGLRRGAKEEVIEGVAGQKVRVLNKSVLCHQPVQVPLLKELMRDIGTGCSVAAVITYYRQHLLDIKGLCLKDGIGVADSLHNLRQISHFCRAHFPWKSFHLSYEDLLYSDEMMYPNILAFLADLFFCFEGPGSSLVEDGDVSLEKSAKDKIEVISTAGTRSSQNVVPSVPVSLATKRSFQRQSLEDTANNLGMGRSLAAATDSSHQPLLPRRGRRIIPQEEGVSSSPPTIKRYGRRTVSLCSPQDRDTVHKSVLAWQDDQRVAQRSDEREYVRRDHGDLLANVSFDSINQSFNNNRSLSVDLTDLDSQLAAIDSSHARHIEVESVTSAYNRRTPPSQRATAHSMDRRLEPLMPATLKPTKEREANLSKAEERGDRVARRRKVPSPSHHLLDSGDLSVSVSSETTSVSSLVSGISTNSSSTTEDVGHTSRPARTAEASMVTKNAEFVSEVAPGDGRWAEKSTNFVEYSDHESRKIHQEYQTQELALTNSHVTAGLDVNLLSKSTQASAEMSSTCDPHLGGAALSKAPASTTSTYDTHLGGAALSKATASTTSTYDLHLGGAALSKAPASTTSRYDPHPGGAALSKSPGSTTSFAELKRLKEKLINCLDKNSGPVGSSNDSHLKPEGGTHPLAQDQTSFVPAPDGAEVNTNGIDLGLSDLQLLRLKLEQKRKEIERKKHRQEVQQNKMRQRLGKAAFMRVVSKHLDGREDDELCDLPETRMGEYLPNSTQAQIQARLGHQPQKVLAGGHLRGHPPTQPYIQVALGPGGQSSITDWHSQSKAAAGKLSDFGSAAQRPGHLAETQQQHFLLGGGSATIDSSLISSQISVIRPFSRAGIQQTINNVRNKWFGTDVVADQRMSKKEDVGGGHDLETRSPQGHSHTASPHGATAPIPIPTREATSSSSCPSSDEDYGSPLDKLNSSLSELQGEIMRLSLQHEQLKAIQPPTGGQIGLGHLLSSPSAPSFPMQVLSHQDQHMQDTALSQHQKTNTPFSVPYPVTSVYDPHGTPEFNLSHPSLPDSSHHASFYDSASVLGQSREHSEDSEPCSISITPNDGYFVSFGDKSTPKRSRPKLSEHQAREASTSAGEAAVQIGSEGISRREASPLAGEATAQIGSEGISGTSNIADEVAATLAGQTVLATLIPQKNGPTCDDSSPRIGFIIKDEAAIVRENVVEDEMQKKRIKLLEMQRKRKEEQERKKTEKEVETTRKQEEKQSKEDEQERKKAEDKARREVIFQQYLQKKQEEEEAPAKPRPKKRDSSASKQRPKSMFVKSKTATPDPGSQGPDSGSSSREDLTERPQGSGRSTPGVMSIMMHSLHGCLPPLRHIRKAVSTNALQGTCQGTSSHRRPPSPDLYRLKQRQRGSSQDSGSETGSGSNPGSDYAGPKLFVKPSSRSNRHIIVNAISHCCLAGSVNTDLKNKVLEEMSKCEANHFLILFRDAGCQYRGLFVFYPETEEAFKVHGVGPKHIINDVCEKFYKYNSGGKSFSEITSTKHLSVSVDAVVLHSSVWKLGKAAVKR